MSNWIYGFFMAWGMFLTVPCPKKIWNEAAREQMLVCLPLTGLLVGAVWAAASWLAPHLPAPLAALLLAAAPWLTTGFLHLDGFMDVCDAVLSRRDLSGRQAILKDSHCGAFAVICLVLLALCQWSVFLSCPSPAWPALLLTPVSVRACAGLAVLTLRPMSTSQYRAVKAHPWAVAALAGMLVALLLVSFLGFHTLAPVAASAVYWLAVWGAFRQLDGMSGDISGFALVLGELAGSLILCLGR